MFKTAVQSTSQPVNNIQIVTGVEVTIGNCFPDVWWEILPDAILSVPTVV